MNTLEHLYFEPSGGMFREFEGLTTHFEPKDLSLFRKLLPQPFEMPDHPVVTIFFADYLHVNRPPFNHYRYQEWCLLLKSVWKGEVAWFVPAISVSTWMSKVAGIYLGFPKYTSEEFALAKNGENRIAYARYKGAEQLAFEYNPGVTRPLAPWEAELMDNPSFFKGDAHVLIPAGRGPKAQKIILKHAIQPKWSPEPGMVRVRFDPALPWTGLIPDAGEFPGSYNHFHGGLNLVKA